MLICRFTAKQHRLELVPNLQVLEFGDRFAVLPLVEGGARDVQGGAQSLGIAKQCERLFFREGFGRHGRSISTLEPIAQVRLYLACIKLLI